MIVVVSGWRSRSVCLPACLAGLCLHLRIHHSLDEPRQSLHVHGMYIVLLFIIVLPYPWFLFLFFIRPLPILFHISPPASSLPLPRVSIISKHTFTNPPGPIHTKGRRHCQHPTLATLTTYYTHQSPPPPRLHSALPDLKPRPLSTIGTFFFSSRLSLQIPLPSDSYQYERTVLARLGPGIQTRRLVRFYDLHPTTSWPRTHRLSPTHPPSTRRPARRELDRKERDRISAFSPKSQGLLQIQTNSKGFPSARIYLQCRPVPRN